MGVKNFIFCVFLLASQASVSRASAVVTLFGGPVTVNMGAINDSLDYSRDRIIFDGSSATSTHVASGYYGGADVMAGLGISALPGLNMGLRCGYLRVNQGRLDVARDSYTTMDLSLAPFMLGLRYNQPLFAPGLSLDASLFGGVGAAWDTEFHKVFDFPILVTASGTDFVMEATAGMKYNFFKWLALGLSGGWRQAFIRQMLVNYDDASQTGSGQPLKDTRGRDLSLDFSGWEATLSLEFRVF